jgi:extracellular factor (EF) 3-hydroxypalmitic acid methyl ester biosynthesis protein
MKRLNNPFTSKDGDRDSMIVCRTSQGYSVRASVLRITRDVVAFEVYNPYSILQLSEVLNEFKIIVNDQLVYSGRATVTNLVNTGIMLVCEACLDDGAWLDIDLFALVTEPAKLRTDFANFLEHWDRVHVIQPQYKVVVADMQNYFMDLNRWLEHVELGIRSSRCADRLQTEREVIYELTQTLLPSIDSLFARFEEVASNVAPEFMPFYRTYAKRQLHPQLLCSPFAYRTYQKPLGYAGDYEMVNMIMRDPAEGSSLFSKLVNSWFLSQGPAAAHRNRISYLANILADESCRVVGNGKSARIFNLGCGPAGEIQKFLIESEICNHASFVLLDFNDQTLEHVSKILEDLKTQYRRNTKIELMKKSVHQVLKEAAKPTEEYDVVYCAGVFDYLSDRICQRLINRFYEMLQPGGLLVVTNVDPSNPSRHTMEYLLEWHLIYRNRQQLSALKAEDAPDGCYGIKADSTGCNLFLEIRKPENG